VGFFFLGYKNYVPKVKTGHVAPGISLARVKDRLSQVQGALVEAPLVRVKPWPSLAFL
jgi:phospholipase D1/2